MYVNKFIDVNINPNAFLMGLDFTGYNGYDYFRNYITH